MKLGNNQGKIKQNNLLTDPGIQRLAGNAKVLAEMAGLNFELVFERGCYRAKAGGERLFSVRSRAALINHLSALCDELNRAWLNEIGRTCQQLAFKKEGQIQKPTN